MDSGVKRAVIATLIVIALIVIIKLEEKYGLIDLLFK